MSNRSSCDNFVTVKTSPYLLSNGSRMIPLLTPPRKRIKMDFCPRENLIWTVQSLIDRFNAPESEGASNSKEKSVILTRVDCLQKNQLQQQFSTEVEFKNLHGPPAERTETTGLESTVENIEVRDRVVSLVNKCEVEKASSDEIISDIHKDEIPCQIPEKETNTFCRYSEIHLDTEKCKRKAQEKFNSSYSSGIISDKTYTDVENGTDGNDEDSNQIRATAVEISLSSVTLPEPVYFLFLTTQVSS
uniref:uncharacterized protein LOC120332769 n=1 Tax=Styela clava TaxID=7725 RepID=UPI00193A0345|nr:uncharacterized protein LOC120332769 [Styela clava]